MLLGFPRQELGFASPPRPARWHRRGRRFDSVAAHHSDPEFRGRLARWPSRAGRLQLRPLANTRLLGYDP